jgi:hypothetical protein
LLKNDQYFTIAVNNSGLRLAALFGCAKGRLKSRALSKLNLCRASPSGVYQPPARKARN